MKITITKSQVKHSNGKEAIMPIINADKALSYRLAGLIATMVLNEASAQKGGLL